MHYFRYRPYSEMALKELMYSEMFFSSPEECNDPFDSKTFYVFGANKEKWTKVIELASQRIKFLVPPQLLNQLSDHICKQCPLSFDEATKKDFFIEFSTSDANTKLIVGYLAKIIQELLKVYLPSTRYFVSFSGTNDEPLMWSHYADKHKGFCLVFKSIDGALNLSPNYKKDSIRRQTQNGIANEMSFGLPESFKFGNIDYKADVEFLDAFSHMPAYVSADVISEEERLKLVAEQESHYLQKGQSWFYENESRLILPPPPSWLFGEHIEYTKQERLFHYEPSQLVGIIYGARMTVEDKNRIREILKERKNYIDRVANYKRIMFWFLEFEAKLSPNQRKVEIEPLNILSYKAIPLEDENFERLYSEWKDGVGHEVENSSSKWVKVE